MKYIAIILTFAAIVALPVLAQDNNKKSTNKKSSSSDSSANKSKRPVRKEVAKIAPEREGMALAFMRKNHPDLEELLIYLKENDVQRYRLAVSGLYRTSMRLAQYHDRGDSTRYKLELKLWKAESRGWLAVANMKMSKTPDLEKQLHEAVSEEMDIRLQLLKLDRQRKVEQLNMLDGQIEQLSNNRDAAIEKLIRQRTGSRLKSKAPPKKSDPPKSDARKAKK